MEFKYVIFFPNGEELDSQDFGEVFETYEEADEAAKQKIYELMMCGKGDFYEFTRMSDSESYDNECNTFDYIITGTTGHFTSK